MLALYIIIGIIGWLIIGTTIVAIGYYMFKNHNDYNSFWYVRPDTNLPEAPFPIIGAIFWPAILFVIVMYSVGELFIYLSNKQSEFIKRFVVTNKKPEKPEKTELIFCDECKKKITKGPHR